jgi:hypothetical protein
VLFAGFKYSYRRGTFELFSIWYPTSCCLTMRVAFIDYHSPPRARDGRVSLAASFARALLLDHFSFFLCMVTDNFFFVQYFFFPPSLALLFRLLFLPLTRSRSLHPPKILLPFSGIL